MTTVQVARIPMAGPGDVSTLKALLDRGGVRADEIVAILAKTEGNGCVNDFTRGYAVLAFQVFLAEVLGVSRDEVARRIAFVMSGGTEGVLSPHATVFARRKDAGGGGKTRGKRLAIGAAHTRPFAPEEIGRMPQVLEVARAVGEAMRDAGIDTPGDVHFVQIKCPLLTSERIEDAHRRGQTVATTDTYESMGFSRGASALGVGLALGEIAEGKLSDDVICKDWGLYSSVASTSAGVELMNCEIILMGNSEASSSEFVVGHAVMKDAIDGDAVRQALREAGLRVEGTVHPDDAARVVNVFAKAEADPSGYVRGRRHTMLNDSDINNTRHARAVVGAVVASIVGDPMVYV
ncbi:MAG TPA: ring-opening amidohydrolase, partial [Thermodesulfobacteriota bacterium]